MLTNRECYILLNLIPDIGSLRLKRLLEHFGSLERLWRAAVPELQRVRGIGPLLAHQIATGRRNTRGLADELALAGRSGVQIVTLDDAGYPKPLRDIPDPPLALYLRGTLPAESEPVVAMVGSRHASPYGVEVAERLSYDLALRGVVIVSGLARGIDGAAHRGALKAKGRTLALLGNGLASIYPPEHDALAKQIAASGALISEYPMRMAPRAQHFPRRNRLISGLAAGVVVVEAARRSGALITCDCALEQGREVFAVPGKITTLTAQGTNQLLREGATLVTCAEDIVEELGLADRAVASPPTLSAEEQRLLAQLRAGEPLDVDTVASATGLPAAACAAALLSLELKHAVTQLPGKRFVKREDSSHHQGRGSQVSDTFQSGKGV